LKDKMKRQPENSTFEFLPKHRQTQKNKRAIFLPTLGANNEK